jgi:hypothetical protein
MALTNAGRNYMAGAVIANPTTLYDVTNAYIGVGGGAGATDVFDATENDLQGASKFRQVVDSAPGISTNVLDFVATFGTANANFEWVEWGVFNHASAGDMLNRVVESPTLGTKTSAQSWEITCTLTVNAA